MTALARRLTALFHRSALVAALVSAVAAGAVAIATVTVIQAVAPASPPAAARPRGADQPVIIRLPARPESYLGAYVKGVPASYQPVQALAAATQTHPDVALYYSGWGEAFQAGFAQQAAGHDAVPLVQIDPGQTSLTAIASGAYDAYLETYAKAVASFGARTGRGVIIGFAHEPNGRWYPWGYRHATPRAFWLPGGTSSPCSGSWARTT